MKNVLLYAYTAHNFGDDLFIDIVCRRYPQTNFYLYAARTYQETFQDLNNLHIIPWPSKLHRPFLRRKIDLVLYVGGSLFMQTDKWQKELKRVNKMQINKKPFFILGANFGPFQDEAFVRAYEKIFAAANDVCFRDQASYDLFAQLPTVRQAADIAFQYKADFPLAKTKDEKSIVISVIYPSIRPHLRGYDQAYFQQIAQLASQLIRKGYQLTLLAACKLEDDHLAIQAIVKQMPADLRKKIRSVIYEGNLPTIINIIASAHIVIASRFHAMIIGLLLEKHVFPISYSEKMTNVIHDLSQDLQYVTIQELNKVKLANILPLTEKTTKKYDEEIEDAQGHFLLLDQYLR